MADTKTYADVQARAKELGIPAVGKKREFLEAAIAASETRLADAAPTAHSGESTQGGDTAPADDSGATAPDEAGTPPVKSKAKKVKAPDAVAEPVGSANRVVHWNCSVGDLDGATEEAVNQHIADVHA